MSQVFTNPLTMNHTAGKLRGQGSALHNTHIRTNDILQCHRQGNQEMDLCQAIKTQLVPPDQGYHGRAGWPWSLQPVTLAPKTGTHLVAVTEIVLHSSPRCKFTMGD